MSAKRMPLSLVVLALSLTLLWATAGCEREGKKAQVVTPRATVVTLGEITARRVENVLNQVGTISSPKMVTIRSEIAAPVEEILFQEGAEVKRGKLLVKLDAAKVRADMRNLQQRINQLKIRLAHQKRNLERNKPLVKDKLVSQMKYDDLETEIALAKAALAQAQADMARQKEMLADTEIRAPFDGVVGSKNLSVGDYLKAGEPVVKVVSLNPLEMEFSVPERFKAGVFQGQEVRIFTVAYPGRKFTGKVSFISPVVDSHNRSFKVKAMVDNDPHLLNPGMFGRLKVTVDVRENAMCAPWASIIQTEKETYIYLVEDGKAKKVPVSLGHIENHWAEIVHPPLKAGSKVILEGKFMVKDGGQVRQAEAKDQGETAGGQAGK
ncbi:MAG: efflux RND transporter periplasmic adaptor subunit [Deltaproteobacteria bacterium]|nr:efflux RND transporter periplasmic adaptor subunit [Deltaproteobacteria bacterium]